MKFGTIFTADKTKNPKKELLHNLRNDLPVRIVVFFVAVPLCLGIALASGAPLFAGIIVGSVGGIVVVMNKSRQFSRVSKV